MNEVEVNITGTENVSDTVESVADSTRDASVRVTNAMGSTEEAFDTAARSSGRYGAALDMTSGAASQLSGAVEGVGGSIQAVLDLQNAGAERARALARAQNDVEQAYVDGEQAAIDLKQAEIDLNQSRVDGKQYALDAKQAEADRTQAMIDARSAQEAYNEAVKEFGVGSIEADQAAQDLKQANLDLEQANIDAEQSTVDMTQAQADAAQALADTKQAGVDAKGSALDLAEAQSEVATQSSGWQNIATQAGLIAPVIMGVVAAVDLLVLANTALHATMVRTAAAAIATRVATLASAVATGVATAAQWLWNAAFAASGIGLIVIAIAALIAGIIYLATQTTFFQDLWEKVWGAIVAYILWVRDNYIAVFKAIASAGMWLWNQIVNIGNGIRNVFSSAANAIWQPFKWAFNMIAWAWNNTAGRLSFRIPDWVPGVGGAGFSMPRLPMLATGGEVTRTGLAIIHKGETVTPAGHRPLSAGGSGADITLVIDLSSVPAEIRTWIKKMTRVYGGSSKNNVQIAWG
jgi:hypothetical protein